jgi:cytochrome b subunit of formate dehydrogenase
LRRIDPVNRVLHLLLMVSFLGLAATGLPLLFSDAPWASRLVRLFGDFAVAGTLHRVCAVILLVTFGFHAGQLGRRIFIGKEYDLLWGPESMVPQPRDFVQLGQHLRWFFGRGAHPQFDQFTYWEKFDYWAVFWGVAVIGSSGLMLWFPTLFSYLVPGRLFNVALLVHGEEALLAAGFIFTIHFFHGHLRPEKLPMDLVIFTGRITEQEMAHERPGAFQRLRRDGRLERLMIEPPAAWTVTAGRIIGAIAVGVGLVLVVLILSVLLSEHS